MEDDQGCGEVEMKLSCWVQVVDCEIKVPVWSLVRRFWYRRAGVWKGASWMRPDGIIQPTLRLFS